MPDTPPKEYVLGTGLDELERLAIQHRLWSDAAHAAWRKAAIAPGLRVLDVGCGPGHAAFDLAQMVTTAGRVVGVDESAAFVQNLREGAAARGLAQIEGVVADVHALPAALPRHAAAFDIAYARWVLCFVLDPEAVLAGVARLLKPGGRFVVHDYFNYTAMTWAPRSAAHDKAVAATAASWRERGGDPDIAGRLPAMLARHGFALRSVEVHQRLAFPGESMWAWPDTWWRVYAPKLVAMGRLTQGDCDALLAELDRAAATREGFIACPPVYEIVAVRGAGPLSP